MNDDRTKRAHFGLQSVVVLAFGKLLSHLQNLVVNGSKVPPDGIGRRLWTVLRRDGKRADPTRIRNREAGNNADQLERIFFVFTRWSGVNDVLHILAFALNLWALSEVFSNAKGEGDAKAHAVTTI